MSHSGFWMGAAATLGLCLGGCDYGDGAKATTAKTSMTKQIRTVTGSLGGAVRGKVAVAAKTEKGKVLKAVIDPKTNRFSVNLPKGEAAVMTVRDGDVTRKVTFVKSRGEQAEDYEIPSTDFSGDADLGTLGLEGDGEIVVGDDEGEHSVYEYVDCDSDGEFDFLDADDDGDGTLDLNDEDFVALLDWLGEAGWGEDEWFELDDFCDLDAEGLCLPEDDEFFGEDECNEPGGAEYCYEQGEEGWYETPDGEDWWCGCEGAESDSAENESAAADEVSLPDSEGLPADDAGEPEADEPRAGGDWYACTSACAEQCDDDAGCNESCVAECR